MKKALLIIGIILIVLGAFSILLGGLFAFVSTHTLDGSAELYHRQRLIMLIFLATGVILLAVGIVLLALRKKVV